MKKIIYSLVIMIAAGSLFTSCVENTEPQGIKTLRESKADYLTALSNLRAADAEKVKAEAALVQAQAATEQARAALKQAYVKAQELENEKAALQNEEEAARVAASIDSIIAKAEQDAVAAAESLAVAQWNLEEKLREIEAKSIGLTEVEATAIKVATDSLNNAYNNYNWALAGVNAAQYNLWKAEYDAAAGVKGYETAESYHDSIAAVEEVISLKEASIATLEAIKLAPEFAKDSIEANNAKIKELEGEKLAAESEKTLYEATTLYEANKAYAKKVEEAADKLPEGATFEFVDKDGKAVKYPLTNGKGLDENFKTYVNTPAPENGIKVSDDAKNILVGLKPDDTKATEKELKKALTYVDSIVNALNRDMVVVNDSTAYKEAEEWAEAAHIADSVFDAHYDILKGGLKEWSVYKDSVAKIDPLKKKLDSLKGVLTAAEEKLVGDTVTVLTDAKTLATAYVNAIDNFEVQAILFATKKDTAKFISAVNALGTAQAAYLNRQDTVVVKKEVVLPDGVTKATYNAKVSFAALTKADFIALGDYRYKEVLEAANCGSGINAANIAAKVYNKVYDNYDGKDFAYKPNPNNNKADTVKWLTGFDFAKNVFTADTAAVSKAKADTVAAFNAVDKYTGLDNARDAYYDIYASFFGYNRTSSAWHALKDEDVQAAQKFPYSVETFCEPANCVKFNLTEKEIINNKVLSTILNQIDPASNGNANASKIFVGPDKKTEFWSKFYTEQFADYAANFKWYSDQLANINTQVAAIKADVDKKVAEVKEATAAYKAAKIELCGADKKGEPLDIVYTLDKDYVDVAKGVWDASKIGGKQLEWADELAAEYPEIVKAVSDKTTKLNDAIDAIRELNNALDEVAVELAKFADTEHVTDWTWTIGQIIAKVDWRIEKINKEIEFCEGEIARFAKAVAKCEAGYSPAEVKIEFYEGSLAAWENLLKQAEFKLAIAQKAYDEAIAKYGVAE